MWRKRSREGNLSLESFTPVYLNFILSTANGPYSFRWSCWSLLLPDDAKFCTVSWTSYFWLPLRSVLGILGYYREHPRFWQNPSHCFYLFILTTTLVFMQLMYSVTIPCAVLFFFTFLSFFLSVFMTWTDQRLLMIMINGVDRLLRASPTGCHPVFSSLIFLIK
jgi:hypothetical protein